MAAITIRQLDDSLKQRLRIRAAAHGRSMEAEARIILATALGAAEPQPNWVEQLHQAAVSLGGVDLDIPAREPAEVFDFTDRD